VILRREGKVMTIAGLWDECADKASGKELKSFRMVIAEPNVR
jgi:putative SOS response-associated peptidase YedK